MHREKVLSIKVVDIAMVPDEHIDLCCGVFPIMLFAKEARVLMVKQVFASRDYWGFPKGHKKDGEDDIKTASRELKEETSLEIAHLIHVTPFECSYSFIKKRSIVTKRVLYFLAYIKQSNNVVLNGECLDYKWVPVDFVQDYLSHDTILELLRNRQ